MVTVHEVTAGLRHTQDARRPGVTGAQTWRAWLPQPVLRHRDGHVLAGVDSVKPDRQLLALTAEGHSNTAIAQRLVISASAVENTSAASSPSLACRPTTQHRRVLAVLAYLRT